MSSKKTKMVCTKLFVGNLPNNCSVNELKALFERHGKVEECDIIKKYGFVHMFTERDAKAVIDALNNTDFMGSKITVEVSHSKVRQKPGMGGKRQCFKCGRQGHWSKECPKNANPSMDYHQPQNTNKPVQNHSFQQPSVNYHQRPTSSVLPDMGYREHSMSLHSESIENSFLNLGLGVQSTTPQRMRQYPEHYERNQPPPASTIPLSWENCRPSVSPVPFATQWEDRPYKECSSYSSLFSTPQSNSSLTSNDISHIDDSSEFLWKWRRFPDLRKELNIRHSENTVPDMCDRYVDTTTR